MRLGGLTHLLSLLTPPPAELLAPHRGARRKQCVALLVRLLGILLRGGSLQDGGGATPPSGSPTLNSPRGEESPSQAEELGTPAPSLASVAASSGSRSDYGGGGGGGRLGSLEGAAAPTLARRLMALLKHLACAGGPDLAGGSDLVGASEGGGSTRDSPSSTGGSPLPRGVSSSPLESDLDAEIARAALALLGGLVRHSPAALAALLAGGEREGGRVATPSGGRVATPSAASPSLAPLEGGGGTGEGLADWLHALLVATPNAALRTEVP